MTAALSHPWPTLVVRGATEADARAALAALEAELGELPQAEWIEPWAPDDPEGWEVRVAIPGLDPMTWSAVSDRAELIGGASPARVQAEASGRLVVETLEVDGLRAERLTLDGEPAPPDVLRRDARGDAVLDAFFAAVNGHIRRRVSAVGLEEGRPVLHRRDGRVGVELAFDQAPFEGASPEEAERLRLAILAGVVEGLGEVALPAHDTAAWDDPLGGFSLVIWLAMPRVTVLPADGDDSVDPVLAQGTGGRISAIELQVVPDADAPRAHSRVVDAVVDVAEAGADLTPGPLRFTGGVPTPCWWARGAVPELDDPAISRVRLVPVPAFAADDWAACDVACWVEGDSAFVRVTDAGGRDRLEPVEDRPLVPEAAWRQLCASISAKAVRGLRDGHGEGVEWTFGAESWREPRFRSLLRAAADAAIPDDRPLQRVATVAHSADGTFVRVWFADDPRKEEQEDPSDTEI